MERQLAQVLQGETDNYILPFLWIRGEAEEVLVEEVEKIHQAGIGAFCVESRPHAEFCREGWWADLDILLREAKKRSMKVWILDDKHYPTGTANDSLSRHPKARPWLLAEQHLDVAGPFVGACLLAGKGECLQDEDHRLLKVLAYPRSGVGEGMLPEPLDLTGQVKGELLYWEVPQGVFRIVMIFLTRRGEMAGHISMIDADSAGIMIEEVYEPHYQRYKEEFGKTIAGFFSDEPGFFNQMLEGTTGFYEHKLGTPGLALPWRTDLLPLLSEKLGEEFVEEFLPALWFDLGEITAKIRQAYMDTITGLYRDCFTRQMGDWCREHGVRYIGHVVEDNNCHARLFQGAGHYFRALDGQDMAGVDVVLHQLLPGFGGMSHTSSAGLADGEFFEFVLAKLAGSMASLNERMQGRALCELYGAYGWAEGLPFMKWMMDHMLVRGINHFVPHAFSPAYPDADCPPHFYGRGHNPWYEHFHVLMEYTNKMSHLLWGGRPVVPAAVLYHAEAEWSGGKYQLMQEPCRSLAEHQIDYHIVPGEYLAEAVCSEGRIRMKGMAYQCLVVPWAELWPASFLADLARLACEGAAVFFVDGLPRRGVETVYSGGSVCGGVETAYSGGSICGGVEKNRKASQILAEKGQKALEILAEKGQKALEILAEKGRICALQDLPEILWEDGISDIRMEPEIRALRYFHTVREGSHFYMFFNEGLMPVETKVTFSTGQTSCVLLDLMSGECFGRSLEGGRLLLALEPSQSVVAVFDAEMRLPVEPEAEIVEETVLETFRIDLQRTGEQEFETYRMKSGLFDLTGPEGIPDFAGKIRYRARMEGKRGRAVLELGAVGETAAVWLNGQALGVRICRPYRFRLDQALQDGENELEIQVINSPAYFERDGLSKKMMLSASGLLGPVKLCYLSEKDGGVWK